MVISISEKRKRPQGRGYESLPSIPSTSNELDILLDKWIADVVFNPNHISRDPTEEERRDPRFYRLRNYMQHSTTEC